MTSEYKGHFGAGRPIPLLLSYEFACAVYSTFLIASTDIVSYAVREQNFFMEGLRGKTRS